MTQTALGAGQRLPQPAQPQRAVMLNMEQQQMLQQQQHQQFFYADWQTQSLFAQQQVGRVS
jgi:hypothetical protein